MGIPNPFETSDEIQLRNKLWKDKKVFKKKWEQLEKLDGRYGMNAEKKREDMN